MKDCLQWLWTKLKSMSGKVLIFILTALFLTFLVFMVLTSFSNATTIIIQDDSAYVSYTNIYADTMSSADSVVLNYVQGSDTTNLKLTETVTGFYEGKFQIDSVGFILEFVKVWDWQNDGTDRHLILSGSLYSKNINDFKGVAAADSGINQVTFLFYDTVNAEDVTNLEHNVKSVSQSIDYDNKFSNSLGSRLWSLNDGDYVVFIASSIYTANNIPDTFTVSGITLDTIKVYPSATAWPHKSRVYSYIMDKDDTGREGVRITYSLQKNVRYDDKIVYQWPETTYTDSNGYWYADLIRSDSLVPTGRANYTIKAMDTLTSNIVFNRTVRVPDSVSWFFKYWTN